MAPERATLKELRTFGIGGGAILLALPALAALLHRSPRHGRFLEVLLAVGAILVLLGALAPRMLAPVYKKWMLIAEAIARFNTRILLTLTFFLVLAPLGLMLKLLKRDPMERQREPGSYWRKPRSHSLGDKHFERQF